MQGSHIWKVANKQRGLIQQHNFWEIKAGDKALLWEDSWQQLPRLKILILDLDPDSQNFIGCNNHLMVKEYWKPSADGFRSWKEPRSWNISLGKNLSDKIWPEICTRRLKKMHGSDIIRWVHRPSGNFSVREAYRPLGNTCTVCAYFHST